MLSLIDLSKRYGDVIALDGASFDVPPGRIVGFLGPNGAGKTTAMRCVFGLVRPDSGVVRWNGGEVTEEDRLRFGYMPEERGLYPKMRVREQLTYLGRLSGLSGSAAATGADRWLHRLGLEDRAQAKVEDLSHGNQQRVQLAAALVHDPEVVVLDEPFAGLDPLGVDSLAVTLSEIAHRGAAIVFSSHQLDLVEDVCDDVAIIDRGRVVLTGGLDALKSASAYRRLDIVVDGNAWVPEIAEVNIANGQGRHHCIVDRNAPIEAILAEARSAGEITRFSFSPPTLSDLFREAVGR